LSYYIKFDDGPPLGAWVGVGWVIWMMAKVEYVGERKKKEEEEKVKEDETSGEKRGTRKNGWLGLLFRHVFSLFSLWLIRFRLRGLVSFSFCFYFFFSLSVLLRLLIS
jgi:hypothetical protein